MGAKLLNYKTLSAQNLCNFYIRYLFTRSSDNSTPPIH